MLLWPTKPLTSGQNQRNPRGFRFLSQKMKFDTFRAPHFQSQLTLAEQLAKTVAKSTNSQKSKIPEIGAIYVFCVRAADPKLDFGNARTAPTETPPSTNSVCPVMYCPASDASKSSAPSRSPGVPGRPNGIRSQRYSTHPGSSYNARFCSVLNHP